ncbi:UNVERIFIED_CONTAM: movement protein [Sesamum radiatum]|uniref:Movement protein n=1 Tax=Sesamum radiatum TaxID=300843 RepID=A0AAW2UAQ0_SESRA
MTVSNKIMERIMRQDSNLSPYDGFRIGGIGKVLNQIGLNQRRHHIIYKVSSGESAIPMELTGNVMEMQLIPKEEILEELSKLREEVATTMKWIHIGAIEVVIKATFKEGIDSEIHLSIMDRRINNLRDGCLGTIIENLYAGKLMFDIHPRIAYNLADQDFSRVLTLHQDFKRKDLMKEGNRPYSITYRIAYALSNTHHSDLFLRKEYIEIPRIFKEFAKQPVIGRYEGMLEIAGHEILVTAYIDSGSGICTAKPGVFPKEAMETLPVIAGRDFSQKILILNKGIREAKVMIGGAFRTPWFRVKTPPIYFHDTGADILLGNNFIQTFAKYVQDNNRNLLIFTTNCGSEIQVLRREKAFNRIMPINFRSKRGDFDAKLTHPKMQDRRRFGKTLLSFRQQGLIDSDFFYKESEEEIKNLKEALQEIKSLDISEESKLSLENVKRLIQRNFSENPLAWWDRNKIEATLKVKEECKYEYVRYKPIQMNMEDKKDMQMIIKEHINLGLIEPGISAYSSPDFLVLSYRNTLWRKSTIFQMYSRIRSIYRASWELSILQVCSNLPKLAIPQDEDELVVYTDANDYRWAAVLMKKTTIGEEPCRYTGGLFSEQQAQVWHINEKEFFAVWKAFKKWPLFLLAKNLH